MKDYLKSSSKRRRGSDTSSDFQPFKRPVRSETYNNADRVSELGDSDGEANGASDNLSFDTAPARYSPRPIRNYRRRSSVDSSCTIETPRAPSQQMHRIHHPRVAVMRAQETSDLISHLTTLTRTPAMMPHLHAFEFNSSEVGFSAKIEMNTQRIQCTCCLEWFFNAAGHDQHKKDLPLQCNDCGCCFNDAVKHAQDKHHSRCFIEGCTYHQRFRYSFSNGEIQNHVDCHHA